MEGGTTILGKEKGGDFSAYAKRNGET